MTDPLLTALKAFFVAGETLYDLVGGRVFFGVAVGGSNYPYVVIRIESKTPIYRMQEKTGTRYAITVEVWDKDQSSETATNVGLIAEASLQDAALPVPVGWSLRLCRRMADGFPSRRNTRWVWSFSSSVILDKTA